MMNSKVISTYILKIDQIPIFDRCLKVVLKRYILGVQLFPMVEPDGWALEVINIDPQKMCLAL